MQILILSIVFRWYTMEKGKVTVSEIWDQETKSQKENCSQGEFKTSDRSPRWPENAPRLGMAPRSEKICLQQGLSAHYV